MKNKRFLLIDGLRGIAAMWVVLFHFWDSPVQVHLTAIIPDWLAYGFARGYLGVQIFFVISGFVIAYSTRYLLPTLRNAFNFTLRRQLRLDPPYVICLLLVIVNLWIPNVLVGSDNEIPKLSEIPIYLLYLQNLVGLREVNPVFWTLCLEIQFYLLFIVLMSAGRRSELNAGDKPIPFKKYFVPTYIALFVGSQIAYNFEFMHRQLFVSDWHLFSLGVLCCWGLTKSIPKYVFLFLAGVVTVNGLVISDQQLLTAGLTSLLIFAASERGKLTTWLKNRPIQFLGKISYSLYLVHFVWDFGF